MVMKNLLQKSQIQHQHRQRYKGRTIETPGSKFNTNINYLLEEYGIMINNDAVVRTSKLRGWEGGGGKGGGVGAWPRGGPGFCSS